MSFPFEVVKQVQSAKYLEITIADDLAWGQRTEISAKATATKTLGFLRRNSAFAPRHTN